MGEGRTMTPRKPPQFQFGLEPVRHHGAVGGSNLGSGLDIALLPGGCHSSGPACWRSALSCFSVRHAVCRRVLAGVDSGGNRLAQKTATARPASNTTLRHYPGNASSHANIVTIAQQQAESHFQPRDCRGRIRSTPAASEKPADGKAGHRADELPQSGATLWRLGGL